jgi:aminopeptidase N
LLPWIAQGAAGTPPLEIFAGAWGNVLLDEHLDYGIKAAVLALAPAAFWHLGQNPIQYATTSKALRQVKLYLATTYFEPLLKLYEYLRQLNAPVQSPEYVGLRQLKNLCLSFLMATELPQISHLADQQLRFAELMADQMVGLSLLATSLKAPEREEALTYFAQKWHDHPLLLQKWFSVQVLRPNITVEELKALEKSPYYQAKVPNFIRALWGAFTRNYEQFHREEGQKVFAQQLKKIDAFNPQIAASLAKAWRDLARYPQDEQKLVRALMKQLLKGKISRNLEEVLSKISAT